MSYQKQNFANGEVLTASQLNHIENGIADVESTANATKGVVDKIIDPTLSVSGKAADAAKVGEAVEQVKEDIGDVLLIGNEKESLDDTDGDSKGSIPKSQMYILNDTFSDIILQEISYNPSIVSKFHVYLFERNGSILTLSDDVVYDTNDVGTINKGSIPINKFFKHLMVGIRNDNESQNGPRYSTQKASRGFLILENWTQSKEYDIKNAIVFDKGSLQIGLKYIKKSKKIITVAKDGSGDYLSISDAIINAGNLPIYIKNGVYDEEIHCDEKVVTLIGQDKYRTVIRNTNGNYGHDPIYMSRGTLSNLTIYAQYVQDTSNEIGNKAGAYAVHLDSSYQYNGQSASFDNCRFISDFGPALGSGLRANFIAEFTNCEFVSNANNIGSDIQNGGLGAVYIHNDHTGKPIQANQKAVLRNCIVRSKMQCAIYLLTSGSIGEDAHVEFESINSVYYSETSGTTNIFRKSANNIWLFSPLTHGNNIEFS